MASAERPGHMGPQLAAVANQWQSTQWKQTSLSISCLVHGVVCICGLFSYLVGESGLRWGSWVSRYLRHGQTDWRFHGAGQYRGQHWT
jgi:hypothetical protein